PARPVNEKVIEDQIMEQLAKITISPVVKDIVLRVLREETQQDSESTRSLYRSYQKDLNKVIDNLTMLVKKNVSGLISDDDYLRLKKEYLGEKERLEGLQKSTSSIIVDWLARAEKVLDFAVRAEGLFKSCDLEVKKQILLFLGSNFILRGNTLELKVSMALANINDLEKVLASRGHSTAPIKHLDTQQLTDVQKSSIIKGWGG
ncbi:MAG: hypothetical protein Q7U71_08970, partial [bacterium]|nr:hypothetical protein [bacterium]